MPWRGSRTSCWRARGCASRGAEWGRYLDLKAHMQMKGAINQYFPSRKLGARRAKNVNGPSPCQAAGRRNPARAEKQAATARLRSCLAEQSRTQRARPTRFARAPQDEMSGFGRDPWRIEEAIARLGPMTLPADLASAQADSAASRGPGPYEEIDKLRISNPTAQAAMDRLAAEDEAHSCTCVKRTGQAVDDQGVCCNERCINRCVCLVAPEWRPTYPCVPASLLNCECTDETCPVGDKLCQNRRIQRGHHRRVKTQWYGRKGWGIAIEEPADAGDFVLEFLGEVRPAAWTAGGQGPDPTPPPPALPRRSWTTKSASGGCGRTSSAASLKATCTCWRSHATWYWTAPIAATRRGSSTIPAIPTARFSSGACLDGWGSPPPPAPVRGGPACLAAHRVPSARNRRRVGNTMRLGLFARRAIPAGEELTFDYQFQNFSREAWECLCGAESCQGQLGSGSEERGEASDSASAQNQKERRRVGVVGRVCHPRYPGPHSRTRTPVRSDCPRRQRRPNPPLHDCGTRRTPTKTRFRTSASGAGVLRISTRRPSRGAAL